MRFATLQMQRNQLLASRFVRTRDWTQHARYRIVRVMRRTLDPTALAQLAAAVRDAGPVAVAHTAHVSLPTLYRALRGLRVCDVTHHSLTATARTAPEALAA